MLRTVQRHLFTYVKRNFCHAEIRGSLSSFSHLSGRAVVSLSGVDSIDFLQGLVTNDLSYFRFSHENHQKNLYTLILNNQGRVMFDLLLFHIPPEEILIECDITVTEKLLKLFKLYKLRRKIQFEHRKDISVFVQYPGTLQAYTEESIREGILVFAPDPRLAQLGHRILVLDKLKFAEVLRNISGTQEDFFNDDHYTLLRYRLGVPEGIADLPPQECFPLESNGDYLNGISFHKGCYVGQELTARTHHTGVVRKRLMPLKFLKKTDDFTSLSNAKLVTETGAIVGKFRSGFRDFGLGLLKFDEALKARKLLVQTAGSELLECTTHRPEWWKPSEVSGFIPPQSKIQ